MTFFEAVEALKLPKPSEDGDKKKKKGPMTVFSEHQLLTRIDLSGFKNLRFSKAGMQDLVGGISNLPCIRAIILRHNGIGDEHEKEVLQLLSVTKLRAVDLSHNEIENLGGKIGRKLRDEVTHLSWFDITQNLFANDSVANGAIISGLRRQKELTYAGLSCTGM